MKTENISTLKIYKLTQAQYDNRVNNDNIDENALYMTTDTSTTASEVTYSNSSTGLSATNIQGAIDQLFTSVSDGKAKVASAITDKGITTASDATFDTMATNIAAITSATTPNLQTKSVTPSETAQSITADSAYDGLRQVNVGAISSTYVGSDITKKAATTITPNDSTQTAVASGVYTTGAITVAAVPTSTYIKLSQVVSCYSGSTIPSSSLGSTGDIYIRLE